MGVAAPLAIATQDFGLYLDLLDALKEIDTPVESIRLGSPIPPQVALVITAQGESGQLGRVQGVRSPVIIERRPEEPIPDLLARARRSLLDAHRKGRPLTLVVGVDPGPRPGVALLADGLVLATRQLEAPEEVPTAVGQLLTPDDLARTVVRVGAGDTVRRNRIVNGLLRLGMPIELVREEGTSTGQQSPHEHAAVLLARLRGRPVQAPLRERPTQRQLRDVQRRSRIASAGTVTISTLLASRVLQGQITMSQAIDWQRRTRSGPSAIPLTP